MSLLVFTRLFVWCRSHSLLSLFRGQSLASRADSDDESEYANSRYVPSLKGILVDLIQYKLSTDTYPSVLPMPEMSSSTGAAGSARRRGGNVEGSARKSGSTARWSRTSGVENIGEKTRTSFQSYSGGRSIVFVVGGISYSELRVAREVMAKEQREIEEERARVKVRTACICGAALL